MTESGESLDDMQVLVDYQGHQKILHQNHFFPTICFHQNLENQQSFVNETANHQNAFEYTCIQKREFLRYFTCWLPIEFISWTVLSILFTQSNFCLALDSHFIHAMILPIKWPGLLLVVPLHIFLISLNWRSSSSVFMESTLAKQYCIGAWTNKLCMYFPYRRTLVKAISLPQKLQLVHHHEENAFYHWLLHPHTDYLLFSNLHQLPNPLNTQS